MGTRESLRRKWKPAKLPPLIHSGDPGRVGPQADASRALRFAETGLSTSWGGGDLPQNRLTTRRTLSFVAAPLEAPLCQLSHGKRRAQQRPGAVLTADPERRPYAAPLPSDGPLFSPSGDQHTQKTQPITPRPRLHAAAGEQPGALAHLAFGAGRYVPTMVQWSRS